MVRRHGQFNVVIAELQGELAATQELLVLPTGVVGVGREPREPLRQEILVGVVLGEVLVTAAGADRCLIDDVEGEVEAELDGLPGSQRLRQVDAQHGVVDGGLQGPSRAVADRPHLIAVLAVLEGLVPAHRGEAQAVAGACRVTTGTRIGCDLAAAGDRVVAEDVLVELQPKIAECIRRAIDVGDRLRCGDAVPLLVEAGLDPVVRALLPIGRSRRA